MTISVTMKRRTFLFTSTLGVAAAAGSASAQDTPAAGSDGAFQYEFTMTESEWRAMLTDEEYDIVRGGGTEFPTTSPYWNTNDPGMYHCRACDLALFNSRHYSPQELGFVFFRHSQPNAVLTGIDKTDYNGMLPEPKEFVEMHCRRCGSHLGHVIVMEGETLHCVNGTALNLKAT